MAPQFAVFCVPAVDGVPVAPCGEYQGQALAPATLPTSYAQALDYSSAGELFAWAFLMVAISWATGLVVGHVLRVIRMV